MQKVISINLNGHAYQLEEGGYEALRAYLADAERDLASNPDRAEIMADLEQAIADKCRAVLSPQKSVVTEAEVVRIVAEMGPVDATPGEPAPGASPGAAEPGADAKTKRLYRITEGAMVGGVCNGIAMYFSLDVTLVRVGFVVTALLSQGFGILAYIVMMFVIPEAKTPDERASAAGGPFNARDVVERARKEAVDGARRAQASWRRQQRHWHRKAGAPGVYIYGPPRMGPVLSPVFGLLQFALFFVLLVAMVSLVNTGEVLGWELPPDMPVWAGLLILLVGYQLLAAPLRGMQYMSAQPGAGLHPAGYGFWNAVVSLAALALLLWFASGHIPEIQDFLQRLPEVGREFGDAMRDLFAR